MQCYGCLGSYDQELKNNPRQGTVKIWCPTWARAYEGPEHFCEQHAETFRNSKDGSFFYGDDADQAFQAVHVIPRNDERYQNACGMVMNGTILKGKNISVISDIIAIVDGKVWLASMWHATNLGFYEDAKKIFPKLVL